MAGEVKGDGQEAEVNRLGCFVELSASRGKQSGSNQVCFKNGASCMLASVAVLHEFGRFHMDGVRTTGCHGREVS